jgi:hypothetical protein
MQLAGRSAGAGLPSLQQADQQRRCIQGDKHTQHTCMLAHVVLLGLPVTTHSMMSCAYWSGMLHVAVDSLMREANSGAIQAWQQHSSTQHDNSNSIQHDNSSSLPIFATSYAYLLLFALRMCLLL